MGDVSKSRGARAGGRVSGPAACPRLETLPVFQGAGPKFVRRLQELAVERDLEDGESVFEQGDPAGGFYLVLQGRVKVFKLGPDGREQILHIWESGEPFGEAAAFEDTPFPAYAAGMGAARVLFFPRRELEQSAREDPDFALALILLLSRRLRRMTALVESLSLREVPSRLANYLLLLSDRHGGAERFDLDVNRTQLAALLGTIPETLSRVLARLSREGWIDLKGPKGVVLKDREAMQELAEGERRLP